MASLPIARGPRIGLVSVSAIPDDPRVRRQGDLFWARGWEVLGVGLGGARSYAPAWQCLMPPSQTPGQALPAPSSLARTVRRLADTIGIHLRPQHAFASYWRVNRQYEQLYRRAREQRVDIWLANDWTALPIVGRLAAEQDVPYAYDTHELAIDEYAQSLRWRLIHRPLIAAVERKGIAGAAVASCVSQGIADRLHEFYGLPEKPLLIRNMPRYEAHPYRPCGETIEVLYHGVVYEGRGLEACIDSVALWRPEFRLTIRGPAPKEYLATLSRRIEAAGLGERVVLAPPVPMIDLVKEAARFDVGLFALPGHSKQNMHVLPNKFFEYTMAGLALCVSDLPEMTALLRQHDLGRLIPEVTPQAIAAAVNGFDRAMIEACKRRALEAAKVLNWEAEADRLFAAIAQAVPAASPARSHAAQ
jgi:glycosyltransferase involved in cell wall biosynthesis